MRLKAAKSAEDGLKKFYASAAHFRQLIKSRNDASKGARAPPAPLSSVG